MASVEGWVLGYGVNSIWQVPLMFVGAWLAARAVRASGPGLEHRVWVGALVMAALLPAVPSAAWEWTREAVRRTRSGGGQVSVVFGPGTGVRGFHLPAGLLHMLCGVYAAVAMCFLARLLWGLWRVRMLRQASVAVTLAGEAGRCREQCAARFGVGDAEFRCVAGIGGPMAMGVLRRTVLLPPSFLEGLTEDEAQVVVAHEMAHLARRDFAKNLLYEVVGLPVMWHPVFRAVRERVAASREEVCDGMAAEMAAGREKYAKALLRLASRMLPAKSARVAHAIGIFDANALEERVMRLTARTIEMKGWQRAAVVACCVALGLATCGSALALRMEVGPVSSAREAGGAEARKVSSAVMQGNLVSKVDPVYPPAAKEAKIQGAVVLKAVIGTNGTVENLQVVSGPKELQRSSLDAVRQWVYKPYLLNGDPMEVETTITVNYSLVP